MAILVSLAAMSLSAVSGVQADLGVQASKEHYCIHPTVSKKANKDEECQNMLKGDSSCRFFKNVQKLYPMQTSHFLQVM